jgi:hypothetical protein
MRLERWCMRWGKDGSRPSEEGEIDAGKLLGGCWTVQVGERMDVGL